MTDQTLQMLQDLQKRLYQLEQVRLKQIEQALGISPLSEDLPTVEGVPENPALSVPIHSAICQIIDGVYSQDRRIDRRNMCKALIAHLTFYLERHQTDEAHEFVDAFRCLLPSIYQDIKDDLVNSPVLDSLFPSTYSARLRKAQGAVSALEAINSANHLNLNEDAC